MEKWVVLGAAFMVWIGVQYWFGKRIFEKEVSNTYIVLHWKLLFARRREFGSYVKVERYLRLKKLNDDQLEKLHLLVKSKIPNVNVNTQIFAAIFTSLLTIATLLFGGVFSGFLGGLISRFIDEVFGSNNTFKIEKLRESMNNIIESSTLQFGVLIITFFLIVSIWGLVQIRLSEAKIILSKIIEQEIKMRK
ncbi:hypothetical protein [Brevibacillus sp. MS2.2]|uniref:hypothetical protein n=1 Tax=Brevibacillus sp. MS2.2 TaxID=2738981 RepID=UPI00156B483C|nr:hypothetical protein [Brevibacillus sp. MS2.2]NRR20614.1 hypothetical protein [Brevibacillus sp. MS2.2]